MEKLNRDFKMGLLVWTVAIFLGFGIFLVTGCGGDSSDNDSDTQSGDETTNEDTGGSTTEGTGIVVDGTTETYSDLDIVSNNNTEAGVQVINGGILTLNDSTITKTNTTAGAAAFTSAGDGDLTAAGAAGSGTLTAAQTSDSIGSTSAGVWVGSSSTANLNNVDIDTNLSEGKGVCMVGTGATVVYKQGIVYTYGDSSHGVYATQGGSITLEDVDITTEGEHCSVLATDQGGGTVISTGGTFIAYGEYSAGIYSTGDIRATNGDFYAYEDRVVCIEGHSYVTLTNCSLYADTKDAVIIYQSYSGDSSEGPSDFDMTGGSIEGKAADMPLFYVTNTTATIELNDVELTSASGILLRALKGAWMDDPPNGVEPDKGGTVTFTADGQILPGDIELDQYSTITAILQNGTALTGAINEDNSGGEMNLEIDASSEWEVTADSYLDSLENDDADNSNISGSGKVYVDGVQVYPVLVKE